MKERNLADDYNRAMAMTDKAAAMALLEELTDYTLSLRTELTREEAREIQLKNIGYWTGYTDHETALRVLKLFETEHPIFGDYSKVTTEKVFRAGQIMGRAMNEGLSTDRLIEIAREVINGPELGKEIIAE